MNSAAAKAPAAKTAFKRHPLTRVLHYLYLLPFLPGLRPILINYSTSHILIYAAGVLIILALIIYGNHSPLLRMERKRLSLYLHYRQNAEHHYYSAMTGYKRHTASRIILYGVDHSPVTLRMRKRDVDALIRCLEEEHVHEMPN